MGIEESKENRKNIEKEKSGGGSNQNMLSNLYFPLNYTGLPQNMVE